MEVRLLDLKRQYETIRAEVEQAVSGVFESCGFVLGGTVKDFEDEVAEYCGASGAVGVASGTDALLLSCRACGVEHGEEVITTPYTFFSTGGAMMIFSNQRDLLEVAEAFMEFFVDESCGYCVPCRVGNVL